MPNLSIKDVPEALAEKLRQRAARNHRSLQGELMAVLESAIYDERPGLRASEPTAASYPTPRAVAIPAAEAATDDLLDRLDEIVAGSRWGSAPILTREQANDRALGRELHYLAAEKRD